MAYAADTYANALTKLTSPAAADWLVAFDESVADDAATKKISFADTQGFTDDDQFERLLPLVLSGAILSACTYTARRVISTATVNWPGATAGALTVTTHAAWGGVSVFTVTYPDHEQGSTRTATVTVTYASDRTVTSVAAVFS